MRGQKAQAGDGCGCAMSARFIATALITTSIWYGLHWHEYQLGVWGFALRLILWSPGAGLVGKIVGIARFKLAQGRMTGEARSVAGQSGVQG
jgi:hypothetical protein